MGLLWNWCAAVIRFSLYPVTVEMTMCSGALSDNRRWKISNLGGLWQSGATSLAIRVIALSFAFQALLVQGGRILTLVYMQATLSAPCGEDTNTASYPKALHPSTQASTHLGTVSAVFILISVSWRLFSAPMLCPDYIGHTYSMCSIQLLRIIKVYKIISTISASADE